MTAASDPETFLRERVFVDLNSGCWLWEKSCLPDGYGHCRINGRTARTHRVSFRAFVGEIPEGLSVLHKCDTPACVNPDHLFVGTQTDNVRDCVKKRRTFMQQHPEKSCLWGHAMRGELSPRAKLTNAAVAEILSQKGNTAALCEKFGVSRATVQRVRRGRWGVSLSDPILPARQTSSGVKGICWHKAAGKWAVYFRHNGKAKHVGLFTTVEEAGLALIEAMETARRRPGEFDIRANVHVK